MQMQTDAAYHPCCLHSPSLHRHSYCDHPYQLVTTWQHRPTTSTMRIMAGHRRQIRRVKVNPSVITSDRKLRKKCIFYFSENEKIFTSCCKPGLQSTTRVHKSEIQTRQNKAKNDHRIKIQPRKLNDHKSLPGSPWCLADIWHCLLTHS